MSLKIYHLLFNMALAWKKLKNDEIKKYKIDWLLNLSNAKKILKDYVGAKSDINTALQFQPENLELINQKAILEFESKNIPNSVNILKEKIDQSIESLFILSRIIIYSDYQDKDLLKNLINKIESLLKSGKISGKIRFERTLIQLLLKSGDYEKALSFNKILLDKDANNILYLLDKVKILEELSNDINEQLKILQQAKTNIKSDTPKDHFLELAEAFYSYQDFSNAVSIFEKITDLNVESTLSNKLLICYFKSGDYKSVLDTCENLQKKYGLRKFYTNLFIEIYNEMGDLPNAIETCNQYLDVYPDDIDVRIAKAFFDYRNDNFKELDLFLKSEIPIDELSKDNLLLLVDLYNHRNFKKDAFDLMYEIRRNFYSHGSIHLNYIGLYFSNSQESLSWLNPEEVNIDTAVNLQDDSGNNKWYIIEDRKDASLKNNELDINSSTAKKILQKKVGDRIIFKKTKLSVEQFFITDIKSKYVYALHESLELMKTAFSDVDGIQGFKVELSEKEKDFEKAFKPIALSLDDQDKIQSDAFNLYRSKKITIGMLSKVFSGGVLNTWANLIGRPEYFLYCCDGNTREREKALEILRRKKELVIDFISLLTIDNLDLKEFLFSTFKNILISQSTLELLNFSIKEKTQFEDKGLFSLGKQDGKYIKYEYGPDEIKKQIKKLETLKNWVKKFCKIVPVKGILAMNANKINQLRDIIGVSFMDSILIAKERDTVLYSDDLLLRALGETEFGISGVWTQVFLLFALEINVINEHVYNSLSLKLALLNYRYTSINSDTLIESAKIANWEWKEPFIKISIILSGRISSDRSSIIVARDFILKLYKEDIFDGNRNKLIYKIIESITMNRSKALFIEILITVFKILDLPFNIFNNIEKQINNWKLINLN